MEKDAAGSPQGHTNPGISRYLASRLPYLTSSSEGAGKRSRSRLPVTAVALRAHEPRHKPYLASRLPYVTSGLAGGRRERESQDYLTDGLPDHFTNLRRTRLEFENSHFEIQQNGCTIIPGTHIRRGGGRPIVARSPSASRSGARRPSG